MKFAKPIGLFLMLAGVMAAMAFHSGMRLFLDVPSAVLVTLCTLGATILGWRPGQSRSAVCRIAGRASFRVGLVGTVIGMVVLLANLNEPSMIGPGLAMSLLSFFYGVMLSLVLEGLGQEDGPGVA